MTCIKCGGEVQLPKPRGSYAVCKKCGTRYRETEDL